jgi:hypothetical protein
MRVPERNEIIDYLAVGHITVDQTVDGPRLGGSVAYAALTAQTLGLRAGIVTAWAEEVEIGPLADIPIINLGAERSTTFENVYGPNGRSQRLHAQAPEIEFHMIPQAWRNPRILHLAPVAREVSPRILNYFDDALVGVTPQGWLREWDAAGTVRPSEWEEASYVLGRADVTILGREDVQGDTARIDAMASLCPILVVTEGKDGARLYTQGEEHIIPAPEANEVDPTGAGDIFAAAFLTRLHLTSDPLDAAQFASQIAARSVEHVGLAGVPTRDDIYDLMAETL